MKRYIYIGLYLCLMLVLSACNISDKQDEATTVVDQEKALIVYFSVPQTKSPDNMSDDEENSTVVVNDEVMGNTQYVATIIQQQTNADIFRIEPVTPYPMDYSQLLDKARKESDDGAMPRINNHIENIEAYDTIFLGYPKLYLTI